MVKTDKDGNFDILIQKEDLDQEVFKIMVGIQNGKQRDTITTNILKFRDKKVRLTIKAEAVTEIYMMGFIPPKIIDNNTVEGQMEEEVYLNEVTGGVPAYYEEVHEVPRYEREPIDTITVNYPVPMIYEREDWKARREWKKQLKRYRKSERKEAKKEK